MRASGALRYMPRWAAWRASGEWWVRHPGAVHRFGGRDAERPDDTPTRSVGASTDACLWRSAPRDTRSSLVMVAAVTTRRRSV